MSKNKLSSIPTNIITGFLGVGKTTTIQQLLTQRPQEERWAVLVNEFGEVGIDGNLFSTSKESSSGVTISQVPGGCICCSNGLPLQMALNLLLAKAKPQRLLIELTGLGHPKEVLAVLTGQYYRDVLDVQAVLGLVDARKMKEARCITNTIFKQQLEIADVVIANKSDLYDATDFPALLDFIDVNFGLQTKLVYQVQQGGIKREWLNNPLRQQITESCHAHGGNSDLPIPIDTPAEGYVRADNQGDGYFSRGWVFNSEWLFDESKLVSVFHGIEADRLKGVFNTSEGFLALNKSEDVITRMTLVDSADSRVEVISSKRDQFDNLEDALLGCVINNDDVEPTLLSSQQGITNHYR